MPHFSVLCITGTQQGKQRPYPQSARYHSSSDGHGIQKLTYRYQGHDFRLTDVHENVVHDRK